MEESPQARYQSRACRIVEPNMVLSGRELPNWNRIPRTAVLLSFTALIFQGVVYFTVFTSPLSLAATLAYFTDAPTELELVLVTAAGIPIVLTYLVFSAASRAAVKWAREYSISSAEDTLALDRRAPVLFLRPFRDDRVSLTQARFPWHVRLLDPFVSVGSLEDLIIGRLLLVGPVVAIGNPKDELPPFGAARVYVDGAKWKETVLQLAQQACIIVIGLGRTSNIEWELEQLHRNGLESKCILFWPPPLSRDHEFYEWVCHTLGIDPLHPRLNAIHGDPRNPRYIVALQLNAQRRFLFLTSSRVTEAEYELAIAMAARRVFLSPHEVG